MSEDPETIGLRPMVVDGEVQADDYEVVWRGLSIARILKQPHTRHAMSMVRIPRPATKESPLISGTVRCGSSLHGPGSDRH